MLSKNPNCKRIASLVITLVVVLSFGAIAFADGATGTDIATSMGDSLEVVKGDVMNTIATVAPFGIAIMGAFLVWRYGLRFFKSVSK